MSLALVPEGPGQVSKEHIALVKRLGMFTTLQGEGIYTGVPSLFIRLFGCNDSCSWCDTKYSWRDPDRNRQEEHLDLVVAQARDMAPDHIVVTGGEPTMQHEAVTTLLSRLSDGVPNRYTVTVESNAQTFVKWPETVHLLSLSPKVHRMQGNARDLALHTLGRYIRGARQQGQLVQVKVVVPSMDGLATALLALTFSRNAGVPPEQCFLQPEWLTHKDEELREAMFKAAHERGFRIGSQHHKVWGVP